VLEKQGAWGLISVDVDKPGSGEVLVRVEASALNPVDWKIRDSGRFATEYPAILGSDPAGVVVEVGEGVTNLAVGDKVFFQGRYINRLAAFKQYTIAVAEIVAKIPDNISFQQAAAVPVGFGAALIGLYGKTAAGGAELDAPWREGGRGKYSGSPIVVFGGSTSVGQYVIQLAKLSGFSPIITTASPHNHDLLKSLGATHAIDRSLSAKDIFTSIKGISSTPFQVVFDAFSAAQAIQNIGYDLLAPGGTLILVLPSQVDEGKITHKKHVVTAQGTVHADVARPLGIEVYGGVLTEYLQSGDLQPNHTEIVPDGLSGIPKGLERLKDNEVSARKLVARPQETS